MGSNVFAKGINFMGNKIDILWFPNKINVQANWVLKMVVKILTNSLKFQA